MSPPIYASNLTASFIEHKFEEFDIPAKVERVDYDKEYVFGNFKVKFIHVTHSIPDTAHMLIKTPVGSLYHGPDFKFDLTPPYGEPPNFYEITKAGHDGLLCLLSDALGSERDGFTLSGLSSDPHSRTPCAKPRASSS
jgi:ribonuclease J